MRRDVSERARAQGGKLEAGAHCFARSRRGRARSLTGVGVRGDGRDAAPAGAVERRAGRKEVGVPAATRAERRGGGVSGAGEKAAPPTVSRRACARMRVCANARAREHAPACAVAGRRGRDEQRRWVGVHDALHRRGRGVRAHRALRGQVALVEGELRVRGLGRERGARHVSGRCLGGSARARRSAAHHVDGGAEAALDRLRERRRAVVHGDKVRGLADASGAVVDVGRCGKGVSADRARGDCEREWPSAPLRDRLRARAARH